MCKHGFSFFYLLLFINPNIILTMKYLFLDIDGVVNSEETGKNRNGPRCNGIIGIERHLAQRVKDIVDATGAVIVLSSSWKVSYEHYIKLKGTPEAEDCGYYEDMVYGKYLVNKFRKAGLKITDTTYRFEHNPWDRGTSITNYLKDRTSKSCRVDGWVVLDDETFRDYDKAEFEGHVVNDKLVLTNYECGISEKDVKKAIKILNK